MHTDASQPLCQLQPCQVQLGQVQLGQLAERARPTRLLRRPHATAALAQRTAVCHRYCIQAQSARPVHLNSARRWAARIPSTMAKPCCSAREGARAPQRTVFVERREHQRSQSSRSPREATPPVAHRIRPPETLCITRLIRPAVQKTKRKSCGKRAAQTSRLNKRGRHLLGGTGAASAVPDWGESLAPQVTTHAGRIPVYASRQTLQHIWVPPEIAADRTPDRFTRMYRGNPPKSSPFCMKCSLQKRYKMSPICDFACAARRHKSHQLSALMPPPGAHKPSYDLGPLPMGVMSDWATSLPIRICR